MNDILIKIDTKTAKAYCENNRIGVQHANLQNKLIFEMSEKIEGSAWLEYEIGGNKNYAVMEEIESGYQIDIKSCLLISDYVNIDLKITESENADGIPIFISTIVELDVDESINATEEEPEYYPDWKTVADSKIAEMNQLKEEIEAAIEETNNLNIDVSDKVNKEVNITLTKKDNTTKRVTLKDGTSLMFNWDGTRLGIKTDEDEEYTYVDLIGPQGIQGETGTTPNLTIGTVVTGNTSSATITGTPENPILNLVLEKGETGETGATGNGISSIEKTGTQDNVVDTYTIYYTNGTTSTFTVTNSTVTNQEFEELKAEHEELVNTLPRVEETGESITLDNTAQYKMNVALNPSELSQTTYTGANLFDKTTATIGWINENGTITFNNEYATSDFIEIDSSLQYSKTATNSPRIKLYDENKNLLDTSSYSDISSFGNKGTYTIPNVNAKYIRFSTRTILDSSSLDAVMFVKGSTLPTSYEPYVGGVPSPNPLYPQPIKKVTGDNTITVCGKNFLLLSNDNVFINKINNPDITSNYDKSKNRIDYKVNSLPQSSSQAGYYYSFKTIIGKTYKVKCTWANTSNTPISNVRICSDTNATTIINNMTSEVEYSFISTQETYYFRVWITNKIGNGYVEYAIVSENDTTFEPYQSQSYPINLGSLEYCKIGNYSDEFALSTGKNLFDKDNINKLNAQLSDGQTIGSSSNAKTFYIPITGGNTYTVSRIAGRRFRVGTTTTIPTIGDTVSNFIKSDGSTSITVTTDINANYLCVYYFLNETDILTEQEILNSIMINEGSTALPWEPYGIGNWYLKKNIIKTTLNNNVATISTYWLSSRGVYGAAIPKSVLGISATTTLRQSLCTMSKVVSSNSTIGENTYMFNANANNVYFFNSTFSTVAIANEALNGAVVYCNLDNPIGEQITDTTLIEQLNNLYNQIKSYKGQTNITQTNAELPFNIDASALYDLNNLISRVATLEVEV